MESWHREELGRGKCRTTVGVTRFPLIVIYADTGSIATKIFENAKFPEALLLPCNFSIHATYLKKVNKSAFKWSHSTVV